MKNNMNTPATLRLASRWSNGLLPLCIALVCLACGAAFTIAGENLGWIICAISGVAVIQLIFEKCFSISTLTLSHGGFSLYNGANTSSYRWSDIERFSISRNLISPGVVFKLSASGEKNMQPLKLFGSDCLELNSYQQRRLPDEYGLGVRGLMSLMSEWHAQFVR